MAIHDTLSSVLRGEDAAELSPEARERLETLAHEGQVERRIALLRDECAARIKQGGATPAVEYLLAAACALNGEVERAHQTLLTLGEKLAVAKQWEPLAAVAERALALEESQAAARLLVRAHEGLGKDPARIEALERAWALMSEDLELGLLVAVRLGEAGEGERRRVLLSELMPQFAAADRLAGLEEAALEFVEHAEHEGLVRLIQTLPTVARAGEFTACRQLLGIALPELERAGRAGECAAALREVATIAIEALGETAGEPWRPAIVTSLRQGPGRNLPDVEAVMKGSGLPDPAKPLVPALERFDQIAALPPGCAVHHDAFGAGRIVSNDAETVVIDFARSKGHKMPYAAARRTLAALAEDDVRLLKLTKPEELKRLRSEDPAELLARALPSIGGAGDAQRIKVFLIGTDIVPLAEWTVFWRKARAGAVKHPRIDASRAFEQHYRLREAGVADVTAAGTTLPALEPRKSVKTNLGTLRKFLTQHPDALTRLAGRFGKFVERAMLDEEGDRGDRARAGLYVRRWFPDRTDRWIEVLKQLWEQGLAISELSAEDEQLELLRDSHASGVESDAILSALDSRFSAVREEAERFHTQLDDRGRADLRRTMLLHATRYPGAALRLIEEELSRTADTPMPMDAWLMLWAALALIEDKPKASVADKVLRWLEQGNAFDRRLAGTSCPGDVQLKVRVLLRQWKSSDRYLFPALEALERLGLAEETGAIAAARQERADRLFDRVGQQAEDSDLPVMTRATWEKLRQELERLERELKTTIPATIQKARELGDLKENAEYHSAKLKQANVSKLVASLQLRLTRARFVDDVQHREGVVGLGTEVTLEAADGGETANYWILGEGEHHHGEHVVSFQAPVGRALMGRSIGDEVELGEEDRRRRWRIRAIERRLPVA